MHSLLPQQVALMKSTGESRRVKLSRCRSLAGSVSYFRSNMALLCFPRSSSSSSIYYFIMSTCFLDGNYSPHKMEVCICITCNCGCQFTDHLTKIN